MPYLTVRETLRYAARLMLSGTLSDKEKNQLVEEVILELGLKECADTLIGDDWRKGISGGEKRRVSVACQLLSNPSILIMDEPTTCLDSFASYNLIETLVNLCRKGRTIFVSIHQPRSDIFKLFDSVILLSKGKTIYAGTGGLEMINHFSQLGYPCPENTNPADYFIDITSVDNKNDTATENSLNQIQSLADSWSKKSVTMTSPVADHLSSSASLAEKEVSEVECGITKVQPKRKVRSSFFQQTVILIERAGVNLLRDNLAIWGNLLEVLLVGIVFGFIFYKLPDDQAGVLSKRAALYTVTAIQTYLMLIFIVYRTCADMKVFDRERADRMYGVVPYLLGQFFSQLPFHLVFPTIYAILTVIEIHLVLFNGFPYR